MFLMEERAHKGKKCQCWILIVAVRTYHELGGVIMVQLW
jgi:hypothetical protein